MRISAEEMAWIYWWRMRRASIKEVEFRLQELKTGSPSTLKYWLEVHSHLEKKAFALDQKFQVRQILARNAIA